MLATAQAELPNHDEPPWRLGFRSLESEHVAPVELPVRGEIPEEVVGTLYRNGPGRFEIYGEPLRHWFDGDGMVHAFRLERGRVQYQNRFVRSPAFLKEEAARRRLYPAYEMEAPGGAIRRFLHRKEQKNAANTNVVFHGGELFALWEGGWPTRLDPNTLEYLGEDGWGGLLAHDELVTAHPRLDEATGELWSFTTLYGPKPLTRIYARDEKAQSRRVNEVVMPFPAMQHDFGLTHKYAVLKFDPYVLPRFPLWLILGQRSYGQCLSWRPELGTKVVLLPRDGGPARSADCEPRFAEHVIHAFDDGEDVVLDVVSFPDAHVMQTLREVLVGPIRTQSLSYPERIRIPPSGRATIERLGDVPMELPRVLAHVGERPRYVFGAAWTDPTSFIAAPARLDLDTRKTEVAKMAPGEFAGEPVPVKKRGAKNDGAAWILTVVLSAAERRSELRIYDGENLSAPPVAVADVPHVIPFAFHGNFVEFSSR